MTTMQALTFVAVTVAVTGFLATLLPVPLDTTTACTVSGLLGGMVVTVFNPRVQERDETE